MTKNRAELSDEDLALALKDGDKPAYDELVRRHQGRVYAVAYRMTSNREDALDVAQDSLIKAYRKIDAWKPTGKFISWLLRLTTNQAIDQLRRNKRRQHERLDERFVKESGEQLSIAPHLGTARRVEAREIDERVKIALDVLSPSQRTVFVLRHYEGMQLAEIAPVLGCTVGSVKVHLFRALKKMRVELADLVSIDND